jgi:hypothetical protein
MIYGEVGTNGFHSTPKILLGNVGWCHHLHGGVDVVLALLSSCVHVCNVGILLLKFGCTSPLLKFVVLPF